MIADFLTSVMVWVFSFFVIGPIEAHIDEATKGVNIPPAIVQQAKDCVATSAPALADRTWSDPWWGVSTVASVAVGMTTPESAIRDALPNCASLIDQVMPALKGEAGGEA